MLNSIHTPHGSQLRNRNAASPSAPLPSSSTPTPLPSQTPAPAPHNTTHHIRTTYHRARQIITHIRNHPTLSLLSIYALLGLAAEAQQPGFLPRASEVGRALVAAVCVGGVVCSVVGLERVGEEMGWGGGVEGGWGEVWRRWFANEDGDEDEEKGEGEVRRRSIPPTDPSAQIHLHPLSPTHSRSSLTALQHILADISPRDPFARVQHPLASPQPVAALQPLNASPLPHRQEHTSTATIPHNASLLEDTHASGLLGPSPMPLRRTAVGELQHFTGKGFYKYQQKLKAVGKWSAPGRSDRSFDEVLAEVVEMEEEQIRGGKEVYLDAVEEE